MSALIEIEDLLMSANDPVLSGHLGKALMRQARLVVDSKKEKRPTLQLPALNYQEEAAGINQGKLDAIKLYRTRTSCGLKEAKDKVEAHFDAYNLLFGPV